jgi:membrane associated rhomboid family serine protease
VSAGGPDLFVVCKNCGSEVSPYITECPYCGNRLRKRAPKIDRNGRVSERRRRRLAPAPALPRLRHGEIPGIRAEGHPYATITIVCLSVLGALLWRTNLFGLGEVVIAGANRLGAGNWWKVITAALTYDNAGYAFAALIAVMLYGWLLERRHGASTPTLLALAGGAGGIAVAKLLQPAHTALGGNGAALALLCAWAVPDLLALQAGDQIDGDLLGTAVLGVVVALMPLADQNASWIAEGVGAAVGLGLGYPVSRIRSV